MKYFESALKGMNNENDFDISVHCDIKIFEWLLLYIEHEEKKINPRAKFYEIHNDGGKDDKAKAIKPEITVPDVISILISADYLRIQTLVEECLRFFVVNINQVLQQPLDLSCIQNKLLRRIVEMMSLEQLDQVVDRRDRILSRIYMLKLEILTEDESNLL